MDTKQIFENYEPVNREWYLEDEKNRGTATITEENELYDIRVKNGRCADCGEHPITKRNLCQRCIEEQNADNLLTR